MNMYAYMFYVFTCINIYIAEMSSTWSVFLSFFINLLFSYFMCALHFYFYLYYQYCIVYLKQ